MSLPYFPLFPTDFEAKTSHLTLEEDGAYNRLLRLMWMTPGCSLPDDDAWIMRRMRVDAETYERVVRVVIDEFCSRSGGRVLNRKLSKVFAESSEAHIKRVSAGRKGGASKGLKNKETDASIARALPKQPEPEPEPDIIGGGGSAREASADLAGPEPQTFRERILDAIGADPISGLTGPAGTVIGTQADMAEASRWRALPGLTEDVIVAEVRGIIAKRRGGKLPSTFRYFTDAMQRLSGALTAPDLRPEAPHTLSAPEPRASQRQANQQAIIEAAARGTTNGKEWG